MAKSSEKPAVYVIKRDGGLFGEFEMDREAIDSLPNSRIKVTLTTGRSPSKLRFWWAFLKKVVDATECAATPEALHETVKLMCGYTSPVMVGKLTVMIPRSIAFSSMTEDEFGKFLDDGLRFIAETYSVTPEMAFGKGG